MATFIDLISALTSVSPAAAAVFLLAVSALLVAHKALSVVTASLRQKDRADD